MMFSLAVLSLDGSHESLNCPFPHELVIVKIKGWGRARNAVLDFVKHDFVVMVNGDIKVKQELWSVLLKCQKGEFFMTNYNGRPCSRIVAGYVDDLKRVGFDTNLKYIFEDGDFYVRASKAGLRFHVVPKNLFFHEEHRHDFIYNPKTSFLFDLEFSRIFAKYKFHVRPDLYNFFLQPWCIRRLPNMVVRVFATCFFIIFGRLKR